MSTGTQQNTSCKVTVTTTTHQAQIQRLPHTSQNKEMKQATSSLHKHPLWMGSESQTGTQDLTRHSPTQTHTIHGDLTRHGLTDCQVVMPTQFDISRPHTLRPGESHMALQKAADPS